MFNDSYIEKIALVLLKSFNPENLLKGKSYGSSISPFKTPTTGMTTNRYSTTNFKQNPQSSSNFFGSRQSRLSSMQSSQADITNKKQNAFFTNKRTVNPSINL
jgi:hypothetical protein